ncbi:YiiD C-terminal domain-containing protein [Halarcobacter anaerophilus]|uniref:Thioesterase n=1 Tax=Halarcobacter anaerophilus TaxID=877500 RepID=A0A4Q0Y1H1_9BACT|nr:YiiD C-terminal domain-containing protein [Halarcobacter anaerophilus]QDF28591.1 putative thioesterase (yiiD_Cterm domain) [Halarcobacter anaerophilus]RXJ63315.1 thioesterase [Halarcobacter anaerophilus]
MLNELEKKLHSEIPLTKYMQLKVKELNENFLITKAPLNPNINDKSTAFAGSLSTLVTISAWSICYLKLKEMGFDNCMIAVIKSDTAYRAPVTKDLICETKVPTVEQLNLLKRKLEEKKSGSIKIESKIVQDDKLCVEYKGVYVVKI